MKRKILFFTLALPVILLQNAQAQTSSRLISAAHWNSNGASFSPSDSSVYKYSGTRGGSMSMNPAGVDAASTNNKVSMFYDNSSRFSFVGDSAYNNMYFLQTFDANNNVTSTITESWNIGTSAWVLSTNRLYTYNASNMITSSILQTWNGTSWAPSTQDVFTYNAAGKLYIDLTNTWDNLTSTWKPSSQKTYYYDGALNQTNETDQTWSGSSPVYTNQWARTYSATNQLLTTTYSTWNGTSWANNTMYTHAYDTAGNPLTLLFQNYNAGASRWDNSTLELFSSFTGSHIPQTDIHQTWDPTGAGTWVNDKMYAYTYNTYNQVTTRTGMSWNVIGIFEFANGDPMDNYRYETYSTTTAVNNVSGRGGEANVYPVPAQNILHIDLNWTVAQSATISIMDITGNTVRQWSVPSGAQYSSAVSVSDLASGTYLISINGEKGQIVKQIVVAH